MKETRDGTIYLFIADFMFLHFSNTAYSNSQQPPQEVSLKDFVELAKEGSEEAQYLIGYSVLFDLEISGEKYLDQQQALTWLDSSIEATLSTDGLLVVHFQIETSLFSPKSIFKKQSTLVTQKLSQT